MFGNLSGGYSDLWKAIIRPPRDEYTIENLGPSEFRMKGMRVKRRDFDIINKQGKAMRCSHFEPVKRPCKELPCVIYLHGNSSSRLESLSCLRVLLPQNISLFAFDFAGCGLSEGEYISLGWYERDDVETIVQYLRDSSTVSSIGLWGRSMGAVTALMHADRDPSIAGLVLDSAFSSLRQLAEDLCRQHTKIPKFVMSGALSLIKSSIQSRAKFDINDLNPLKNHVDKAFIPALFIAAKQDEFISPDHTKALYNAYAGDKNLIQVEGDHNSPRPSYLLDSVGIFFFNTLQVEVLIPQDKLNSESDSVASLPEFHQPKISRNIGNHQDVQSVLEGNNELNNPDYLAEEALFEQEIQRVMEESKHDSATSINQIRAPSKQPSQPIGDQFDLLNLDAPKQAVEDEQEIDWLADEPPQQPQGQQGVAVTSVNKYSADEQKKNQEQKNNNPLEEYFTDYL